MRPAICNVVLPFVTLLALAGCDRASGRGAAADAADSANRPIVEGLTPAQIERRAEPMSPERAAELGIIDSTIRVSGEP